MFSKYTKPVVCMVAALLIAGQLTLSGCGEVLTDSEYLARAKESQEKGQFDASIIDLKNALQVNPDNIEARWLLGEIYLDIGKGADAEKELRRARELGMAPEAMAVSLSRAMLQQLKFQEVLEYEDDKLSLDNETIATLLALKGQASLALGEPVKAAGYYDKAEALNPMEPEIYLGRAHIAFRNNDHEKAREFLNTALEIDPDFADAWSLSGDMARQKGDMEQADADYSKALDIQESNLGVRLSRALTRIQLQKFDAARQDIGYIRSRTRKSPGADYAQGLIHFQQEEYAEAQTLFESALTAKENYLPAVYYLGVTHYMQGNYSQARNYMQQYAYKVPNNIGAQHLLAVLDMRQENLDDARRRLAPILQSRPDDLATLKLLASIAMRQGDTAEAIEHMRKVTELEPDSGDARLRLGLGLLFGDEANSGVAELQQAIELESEFKLAEFILILNHLNEGHPEEALAAAKEFTTKQPESAMAWNTLGLVQIRNKQLEEARKSFEHVLQMMPGEPGAANNLAVLALRRGEVDEAIRLYESILEHRPGHIATVVKLAKLKTRQGRLTEVRTLLEQRVEADPQALELRVRLADLYLKLGEADKGVTLLLDVQDKFTTEPYYLANLGRLQMKAGDLDSAVRNLERAVALQPRTTLAYQVLAEAYEKRGEQDKYEEVLDRTLALNPDHFPTRIKKLKLLTKQGRFEDAEQMLQGLQKVNPHHPEVMVQQARLALAQKKPGDAVPVYQVAMKRFPHPDLVAELALAQWQAGQREASFETLQDWLEKHPEDVVVRYNLANLYLAAGRHEEARKAFSRVVEAQPNHPVALTNLALLSRESDPDKALAYARAAHMLAPGTPVAQDALAQMLLDRGEVGEALSLLEQAVEGAPKDQQIRYHRAQALARKGETARAREELEQMLGSGKPFAGEREARALLDTLSHESE